MAQSVDKDGERGTYGSQHQDLQVRNATINPTEFPATKSEEFLYIYPHPNNNRSKSRKAESRNKINDAWQAAPVRINVKINQA